MGSTVACWSKSSLAVSPGLRGRAGNVGTVYLAQGVALGRRRSYVREGGAEGLMAHLRSGSIRTGGDQ